MASLDESIVLFVRRFGSWEGVSNSRFGDLEVEDRRDCGDEIHDWVVPWLYIGSTLPHASGILPLAIDAEWHLRFAPDGSIQILADVIGAIEFYPTDSIKVLP
jgi:hypothetical protein